MNEFNKYINSFTNEAEYETYINSPIAEVPNTALIDDTGKMIYAKILPNNNNNNYVMFGTTTGTQDFMIGSSLSENSNADCIQIHVVKDDSGINKMYAAPEDVLKMPKYFYREYNGFGTKEGNKILSINKWNIDTSNIVHLERMFNNCSSLTSLDLSNLDTSQANSMEYMFQGCRSLTSLDLSSFNTSKVTSIYAIFQNCTKLTTVDLTSFDTSNAIDIGAIFNCCNSLKSIDLSSFNTSKVTNMYYMFNNCSSLTSLDLSSFDTINVNNASNMFAGCSNIKKLYLSSSFFNSTSLTEYKFGSLGEWTDTESLAMFVEAVTAHDGTGKTVYLSSGTKNALTTEQKTAITNAGWTIA